MLTQRFLYQSSLFYPWLVLREFHVSQWHTPSLPQPPSTYNYQYTVAPQLTDSLVSYTSYSTAFFQSKIRSYSYLFAASTIVPQVSAISSTRIAVLPLTSPTSTIPATSLAFCLYTHTHTHTLPYMVCLYTSLCISAKPTFSLSAIEVTLIANRY